MDISLFSRSDFAASGRSGVRIDYCVFVATLQALQIATATARAQSRCGAGQARAISHPVEPLSEILLGRQDWQEAVVAQGGSFNPGFAQGSQAC